MYVIPPGLFNKYYCLSGRESTEMVNISGKNDKNGCYDIHVLLSIIDYDLLTYVKNKQPL